MSIAPIPIDDRDSALIDAILKGNRRACRDLVNRHKDYAFTIAYRILQHREEAEEAAQDAFVRAFQALAGFNREAKFSTWLYRIVVNCALTIQQKRKIISDDLDEARLLRGGDDLSNVLRQKEQRRFIDLALKQLSADDVTMITLFYLREMSLDEIAETLSIESNTVKVKLHRARKRLGESLEKIMGNEAKNLL
jgi:RNA polymerase sigma factor (sigma-70 family)